jgi:hypothetical protein
VVRASLEKRLRQTEAQDRALSERPVQAGLHKIRVMERHNKRAFIQHN